MTHHHIAVIDIGKTNAKLALVAADDLSEVVVATLPNTVLDEPPYPHFDVEKNWVFLLKSLAEFHEQYGVDAISITTHGACGALIAADGSLAAPILDYEYSGPDTLGKEYNALRPPFEETGSPRLPLGLNLGAQIHWQFSRDASLHERTASIVTYPQYWGHRLTGALACDVSSLGSHTDLWNPFKAELSSLVDRLDIRAKMAPALKSTDTLGHLLPEIATKTGLAPETPVLCGIHDSNASLLPHLMQRKPPFSVVSTGTWVIAMTVGGQKTPLDPARDTLINVNGLGAPVPSARFMGGREHETILAGQSTICDAATLSAVAENGPLLMPAVVTESGPFQGRTHHWIGPEPEQGTPERSVALSFYLALMTAECLSLTGHQGPIIVEGPFAANIGYCDMLHAATSCPILLSESATGTSQGAALLALNSDTCAEDQRLVPFSSTNDANYSAYAKKWRRAVMN